MFNDNRLDKSEIDLIRRTILSVNKNPDDAAIFEEYRACYLDMLRAFRFRELDPSALKVQ